jgi:hypothetical protein
MKRSPAIASLSRDHHQTLVVAQLLRRATEETALEARSRFLTHWDEDARTHFRLEEEVLLPAFAGHGDPFHPLVARTLCEHVEIRHRAAALRADEAAPLRTLHELGEALNSHVRGEERELFVLIEDTIPEAELAILVTSLTRRS